MSHLGKVTGVRNLGLWHQVSVPEEYVEDNYYAWFDTCDYRHCREMHFNARLDVKS